MNAKRVDYSRGELRNERESNWSVHDDAVLNRARAIELESFQRLPSVRENRFARDISLTDAMRADHDAIEPPKRIKRPMFCDCPLASKFIGWALFLGFIAAVGAGLN